MKIRVASVAPAVIDGDVAVNYGHLLRLAEIACVRGVDMVVLPEAVACGYVAADLTPYAESLDSPPLVAFRQLSERHGVMMVVGYVGEAGNGKVDNNVAVWDCGQLLGVHTKGSLWPDDARPHRDERRLLNRGTDEGIFMTRFGRIAVLICYENMVPENWERLRGKGIDMVVSCYNCEDDPGRHNVYGSSLLGVPSVWSNRVGLTFQGDGCYGMNPGTSGFTDASGTVTAITAQGVEDILYGDLKISRECD